MSVPTHGINCSTTAFWRGNCPDCAAVIYFFACSCGSKVFFDSPGPPWPRHADHCFPYMLSVLRNQGKTVFQIQQLLEDEARRLGVSVPASVTARLQRDDFAETGRHTVVQVLPQDEAQRLTGRIVSVNLQVNFFKRFGFTENAIGRGLLGELGREPYAEITARENPDPETGTCTQIVCFSPLSQFKTFGARQGDKVTIFAVPHRVHATLDIWLADDIEL